MSKERIKKPVVMLKDRSEAEACMTKLADLITRRRGFLSNRDALILRINEDFEYVLGVGEAEISAHTDALQDWAAANPEEFPKGRKSLELVSGVIGFRTGTPKLALFNRRVNWEGVLGLLKAMAPAFVRTKDEVDKEMILAAHADGESDQTLAAWGVKVVQDESFFVEPKLADMTARQTTEAA